MADFEGYTHEQLAQLLAGADPEQLTTRADLLLAMATALNGADKEIFVRMSKVEWQGEGAEAFRAWGRHLVEQSVVLADYARTVGNAMQDAGQALHEARATMPPVPERPAPLTDQAISLPAEELERQEAIRVLESLSQKYETVAGNMAAADEPQFRPIEGFSRIEEENRPWASGETHGSARPEASVGHGSTGETRSVPRERSGTGGLPTAPVLRESPAIYDRSAVVAPPSPAVTESQIGTSLDSMAPVAERPLPAAEPAPAAGDGRLMGGGGAVAPDRMLPPTTVGPLQRPAFPASPQASQPAPSGRSPVGGGGPGQGGTPRFPLAPAPEGYVAGRPGGSGSGPGPVGGRLPQFGGAGSWGSPAGGGPRVSTGIIGGTPRPPQSAGRGLPPSTAVGAQTSFAYRDPTTGLVRGLGGVPVMKRPGEPSGPPQATPGNEARYSGGRSRRPRRRRQQESDDRRGDAQGKDG